MEKQDNIICTGLSEKETPKMDFRRMNKRYLSLRNSRAKKNNIWENIHIIQGFEVNGITAESKNKKNVDGYKLYC